MEVSNSLVPYQTQKEFGLGLIGTKLSEVNMMVVIMARDISVQDTLHLGHS